MQIKSDMLDLTWCMIAFTLNELSIQTFKLLLYCKVNSPSRDNGGKQTIVQTLSSQTA